MTKVSADDKTMQRYTLNYLISLQLVFTHFRHVRQLQMQSKEDESVIKQQMMDQKHFLQIALNNYVLCLKAGVSYMYSMFILGNELSAVLIVNSVLGHLGCIGLIM